MRGHIRNRGTRDRPNWAFVVELGNDPSTGKRRQRWKSGFKTRKAAQAALTDALGRVGDGSYVEPTKTTLAVFLRDEWLPSLDKRPSTIASYTDIAKGWIIPALGSRPLRALTAKEVQGFYSALRGAQRRDGRGTISDRTGQYIATILQASLDHAVAIGMLQRNPAANVKRPTAQRAEMDYWTADEAGAFLETIADDRLYAMWLIFLSRGPRRGELAGLRWDDTDLDAGRMAIVKTRVSVDYEAFASTPKTDRGRRSVPIDPQLVAALKRHHKRQLEERVAWGAAWTNSGHVFTNEDGTPLHPEYISSRFEVLTKHAAQRRIRLHDLRHTAATLALQAGIPVKVVSEWLGHASASTTQDIYQHVIPAMSEEAGALLTNLLLSQQPGR